jgi:GT2 family glycosyltransferase
MIYLGIATVNLQRYLVETIESIKCKDEWRLLLIDNGSIDGTDEWIEQSGYEYILNGENKGVSTAWNQILRWGLSHKDMEAVFILNNDIHLHPDCMDWLMQAIRDEGKEAVTGVNIGNKPEMLEHTTLPELRFSPAMNFSLFGFTKPVITRVGFFDEGFKLAYFEDNDYHHRMQLEDIEGVCDMWAPFSHYGSRTIKEGGVKHNEAFEANKRYFKEKWGFLP